MTPHSPSPAKPLSQWSDEERRAAALKAAEGVNEAQRLTMLQALPDDQLIEKVAVEVMHWEKVRIDQREMVWKEKDGLPRHRVGNWLPLDDWNHTIEVVDQMSQYPDTFMQGLSSLDGVWAGDFPHKWHSWYDVIFSNAKSGAAQRNICLAALLAVSPQS